MSNTAVIISGAMRHLVNASSSWLINADYYLITDNKIYNPQTVNSIRGTVFDAITNVVNDSSVTFVSVNILNNEEIMFSKEQLKQHPEIAYHPTIHMAFKWKYAFQILDSIQQTKQYNKILLWRPDFYINYSKTLKEFDQLLPAPNHYYTPTLHIDNVTNYATVSDVCIMVDWEMFRTLSGFFDYYVQFYHDTLFHKFDIHSLLARYLIERSVIIDNILSKYLDYVILRDNTTDMFTNGILNPNYSFENLRNKQIQWWKDNFKNEQ